MNKDLKFWEFVKERLNIYYRKEIRKDPFPWTDNEILREHKFCNSQRHLDSGTRKLLDNVIENELMLDHVKIMNICFYRMFNSAQHFELFGFVNSWEIEKDYFLELCENHIKDGHKIFNNAYAIRAPKPKYKNIIEALAKADYCKIRASVKNDPPEKAIQTIKDEIEHCGDFIAGQIYLDCTYNKDLTNHTGDDFLIVGPGALEGLRMIYGEDFSGYDPESIVRHLWELQPYISKVRNYPRLSNYINGRLSLMDIQHCLCEYRKYLKWSNGQGIRRKYHCN